MSKTKVSKKDRALLKAYVESMRHCEYDPDTLRISRHGIAWVRIKGTKHVVAVGFLTTLLREAALKLGKKNPPFRAFVVGCFVFGLYLVGAGCAIALAAALYLGISH